MAIYDDTVIRWRILMGVITISISIPVAHADARTDFVARGCQKVQAPNATDYLNSFNGVLDRMRREMGEGKFATGEFGEAPRRMYVLSQCMEDLSGDECKVCLGQMNSILQSCLPASSAHVYLDGCFFRLENYNFYAQAFAPFDDVKCSSEYGQEPMVFRKLVERVVKKIAERAPVGNGFSMEEETENGSKAFGMANCWRSLNRQTCSECLNSAASSAATCLPAGEGRVLFGGCFLRYSHYEFSNHQQPNPTEDKDHNVILYCIYSVFVIVSCILAVALGFYVGKATYRRKIYWSLERGTEMDLSLLNKNLKFLQFKYSTLERATNCFSETNKLGHGGFGEIFKGTFKDGREIAIKRLFISRKNRMMAICNELDIMSRAQHKNLVQFLGFCFTKVDSFVVYEYVANRSLDCILFDPNKEKKVLDWKKRLGIIIGIAEGLEYLHKDCQRQIIHRDIKAGNILLDLKLRPKIADFGLARFCSSDKSHMGSTAIAGTLGYMAPEYIANGQLTEKVDVYSFGVLVLEIVSGIQNNKFQSNDGFETLVINTWKHFQMSTVEEIISKSMENEDVEEIKRVVSIGLLCTQASPSRRPSMQNVVQMLNQRDMPLPTPSKPPFTDESMELLSPSTAFNSQLLASSVSRNNRC